MSMRALLLAVRDHLRLPTQTGTNPTATVPTGIATLYQPDPRTWIDVTPDGKPWATAGNLFVAIFPAVYSATQTSTECLDEQLEVSVTVTVRITQSPEDRWKDLLCPDTPDGTIPGTAIPGLLVVAEAIRATCHLNYDIVDKANAYINNANKNAPTNGFVEPLFFGSMTRPEKKAGAWYSANQRERYAGLAITVNFAPARRTQRADLQT